MRALLGAQEPGAQYLEAAPPSLVRQFERLAGAPGGVAQLRELILALAVQGKLVAQDPSDEKADLLIVRSRAARSKLVASGRIGKQKFSEPVNEDETAFLLPKGWVWCRVGDLAWPQAGFAFKSSGFNESGLGLPLIRIRDVGASVGPTTFFSGEYRAEFLVEKGDWLISMDGEFRVRPWHATTALLNQRVTRLVFMSEQVHPAFVAAALQRELIALQGTKAYTTVDHLSGKQIGEAVIALPPANEQARIVSRVDELMQLCDALEAKGRLEAQQHARLLETLLGTLTDSTTPEELAANWQRVADHFDLLLDRPEAVDALEQTILQLAVRGLLVPQDSSDEPASLLLEQIRASGEQKKAQGKKVGVLASEVQPDEVPFEVPDSWAWSRFGQIAEIASDLVQPAGHGSEWQVAPDCIEKGTGRLLAKRTVADAEVKSANHRFHPGQIIYSKIRPSLSKAVIVDFAGLCSADMYPINAKISTQYLLLVILSRCFLDQVAAAENRVKMPKLNQEALTAFLVPVPPLAEQERIVARVSELRRLCTDLRQRLSRSSATQAALAEALIDYALAA